MTIGDNIKKIRKDKKLTQEQLAKKMNISRSHLSDIENNRYNPSYKTLEMLSNKLDVSMLYLTTGNKQISDMDFNINQLNADILKWSKKEDAKKRSAEMRLELKKTVEEMLSGELSFSQTLYLSNALNFLKHSNENDIKNLSSIIINLNRYHEVGKEEDVNQEELLEFIEGETMEYKEFLKQRYHYKGEGD